MKKLLIAAVTGLLMAGCATGPSISPLDGYWDGLSGEYRAKTTFSVPKAWAPGQYVVTGSTDKGKKISVTKTLLVRKEANGWVIELRSVDKKGKVSLSQQLVEGLDFAYQTNDFNKVKVIWMKTKDDNGKVTTMTADDLAYMNMFGGSTFKSYGTKLKTYPATDPIKVPMGTFYGCTAVEAEAKIFGFKVETTTYFHPDVPVNGMVYSISKDGKSAVELLQYGFDGKSEL